MTPLSNWAATIMGRGQKAEGTPMFDEPELFRKQGSFSEEMRTGRQFEKKLRWLIANPPQEAFKVQLTPEMALIILEHNTSNRPLADSVVDSYAKQMQCGLWKYTGQPIIVATDGALLDGQHRLQACVQAQVTIPITLMFGVDPSAFDKIDIGKKRTAADIFAIHGEHNYALLSATMRWVWRYDNTAMMIQPHAEPQSAELWHYMNELHDAARPFVKKHCNLFTNTGWGAGSVFTALAYLSSLQAKRVAEEFYDQLATGNNISGRDKNHPVIRLRSVLNADIKERAMGRGMSPLLKAAYVAKAWNAYRTTGKLGALRWRGDQLPDEPFPRLK